MLRKKFLLSGWIDVAFIRSVNFISSNFASFAMPRSFEQLQQRDLLLRHPTTRHFGGLSHCRTSPGTLPVGMVDVGRCIRVFSSLLAVLAGCECERSDAVPERLRTRTAVNLSDGQLESLQSR